MLKIPSHKAIKATLENESDDWPLFITRGRNYWLSKSLECLESLEGTRFIRWQARLVLLQMAIKPNCPTDSMQFIFHKFAEKSEPKNNYHINAKYVIMSEKWHLLRFDRSQKSNYLVIMSKYFRGTFILLLRSSRIHGYKTIAADRVTLM